MSEAFILQLLEMAESWAEGAGTTLRNRKAFTPVVFTVTRRPEERALLAAAVELHDLVGATAEGQAVMKAMGLEPDAGALLEDHDLVERWSAWKATRQIHGQPPREAASGA